MRWILLDLAVALVALAALAVLVLRLWRKVKALSATVSEAGERIGRATDALADAQLDGRLGVTGPEPAPAPVPPATAVGPAGARQVTPAGRQRGLA